MSGKFAGTNYRGSDPLCYRLRMKPWEHPVPPVLYKYFPPQRLHVLSDFRVRFSQRTAFKDDHELQPDYSAFGTAQEIERHIQRKNGPNLIPGISSDVLAQLIAENPRHQQTALLTAVRNIKSINEMGILCLTETASSEQMWIEYADNGSGFVAAFDTTHIGFRKLTTPLGMGRVSYSDNEFATFLGMMENNVFEPLYRKRMAYSFEQEWRSIRLLKGLEHHAGDIFLSPFDPASVCEIIIRPECGVEERLREILGKNEQYQHVEIVYQR